MEAYPVTDLADYLRGRWQLHREIVDTDGAALGAFSGTAAFTLDEQNLTYAEQGTLDLGTYRGPARRELRYHITGPGQAAVYFDYGDFFHDLDLREGNWQARHPCRDDVYAGWFHVRGPHEWQQHWNVAGPTKNHALTTVFRREHD